MTDFLVADLVDVILSLVDLSTAASFALTTKSHYARYFPSNLFAVNISLQCLRDGNISLLTGLQREWRVPFDFRDIESIVEANRFGHNQTLGTLYLFAPYNDIKHITDERARRSFFEIFASVISRTPAAKFPKVLSLPLFSAIVERFAEKFLHALIRNRCIEFLAFVSTIDSDVTSFKVAHKLTNSGDLDRCIAEALIFSDSFEMLSYLIKQRQSQITENDLEALVFDHIFLLVDVDRFFSAPKLIQWASRYLSSHPGALDSRRDILQRHDSLVDAICAYKYGNFWFECSNLDMINTVISNENPFDLRAYATYTKITEFLATAMVFRNVDILSALAVYGIVYPEICVEALIDRYMNDVSVQKESRVFKPRDSPKDHARYSDCIKLLREDVDLNNPEESNSNITGHLFENWKGNYAESDEESDKKSLDPVPHSTSTPMALFGNVDIFKYVVSNGYNFQSDILLKFIEASLFHFEYMTNSDPVSILMFLLKENYSVTPTEIQKLLSDNLRLVAKLFPYQNGCSYLKLVFDLMGAPIAVSEEQLVLELLPAISFSGFYDPLRSFKVRWIFDSLRLCFFGSNIKWTAKFTEILESSLRWSFLPPKSGLVALVQEYCEEMARDFK